MPIQTYLPGPTPCTARKPSGQTLPVLAGWILLPPDEAALTRRVKDPRREARRMLAQHSKQLLGAHRRGESIQPACPLANSLAAAVQLTRA